MTQVPLDNIHVRGCREAFAKRSREVFVWRVDEFQFHLISRYPGCIRRHLTAAMNVVDNRFIN